MYYKVAEVENDFAAAASLLRNEGLPDQELGFPTILAFDEEKLVGFIATTPKADMVLCGPLVMRSGERHMFTAIKLITLYEQVMLKLGIKSIIFWADENDSMVAKGVKRWFPKATPYAKVGSNLFYTWHLRGL